MPKRITLWTLITLLMLVSACGKKQHAPVTSASSAASIDEKNGEPAFKIAPEQRQALEKAKQLEKDLQRAADQQKRAIEAATNAD